MGKTTKHKKTRSVGPEGVREGGKGLGEVGVHGDSGGAVEVLEGRGDIEAESGTPSLPLTSSLPPVLVGHGTPAVEKAARQFYLSVDAMFDAWLRRTENPNTQRAYRRDVLDFVEFMAIPWPEESFRLLKVGVPDVQAWRDAMQHERNLAPKTLNRRISSLSGFFTFMRETAAAARLPIVVPNPAHSQFIGRESKDPVQPTQALSAPRARQLMALPEGDSILASRDRAIVKFYLYTGARIGTGCRLHVADFHQDHEDATLKIQEKGRGRSKRTIGIHFALAEAIQEYLDHAGITSGPLFRPRLNARSKKLSDRPMDVATMYRLIQGYLERLPGAMKEVQLPDGTTAKQCVYTPHSLRATAATLLLDAGVNITDVQDLLGHKHVSVTQMYDKRRRATKQSASHQVPL